MATGRSDAAKELPNSVYVSSIFKPLQKSDFRKVFEKYGTVTKIDHIQPRDRPRFAFVKFSKKESAEEVVKAATSRNGVYYAGSRLWIAFKKEKKERKGSALIHKLPEGCLLYIFSCLSFDDKVMFAKVCKMWTKVSTKYWQSAKTLSFRARSLTVQNMNLRAAILEQTTSNLETLDLGDSINLTHFRHSLRHVPPTVTEFYFERKVLADPQILEEVKRAMPNLKVVHVLRDGGLSESRLQTLMENFAHVEELNVDYVELTVNVIAQWTSLRRLHLKSFLTNNQFACVQTILQGIGDNLEELSVGECLRSKGLLLTCPKLTNFAFRAAEATEENEILMDFSAAPNLEEVTITRVKHFLADAANARNLVTSCPKLRKLTLRMTASDYHFSPTQLSHCWQMFIQLPNLTYLDLSLAHLEDVEETLPKFEKLEYLLLHRGNTIVREVLISIINGLAHLKLLDLRGKLITEETAVQVCGSENPKTVKDIEKLCKDCTSDADRPALELVIAHNSMGIPERRRWRCGRFIIFHPILTFDPPYFLDDSCSDDSNYSGSDGSDDYDSDFERECFGQGHDGYAGW